MTEFEWDCLQKARIGRSAFHRVGLRNRVRFPSDELSAGELRQRNGPCRVYRLGAPMTGRQFAAMPPDLRWLYLRKLRSHGADEEGVRQLLGLTPDGLSQLLAQARIQFDTPDRAAWERFLRGAQKRRMQDGMDI